MLENNNDSAEKDRTEFQKLEHHHIHNPTKSV
jgi:hypothetical protein